MLTNKTQENTDFSDNAKEKNTYWTSCASFWSASSAMAASCLTSTANIIKNNEDLAIQTGLNWLRDFSWTWFSYELYNIRFTKTTDSGYDFRGQWAGQQLWSTVAMVAGCLGIYAAYYCRNKTLPIKNSLIYTAAAAASVYTWDVGQQVGIYLGQQKLHLSPSDSAFFASIFTGGAEGPTQNFVITLGQFLTDAKKRQSFRQDPCDALRKLGIDSVFSASVGIIPGTVWQLVYAACVIAGIDVVVTSGLVACAVGISNITVGKLQGGLQNTECYASINDDEEDSAISRPINSTIGL